MKSVNIALFENFARYTKSLHIVQQQREVVNNHKIKFQYILFASFP